MWEPWVMQSFTPVLMQSFTPVLVICALFRASSLIDSSGGFSPIATGVLWWASPLQTKPQDPQIKIRNTIYQWRF